MRNTLKALSVWSYFDPQSFSYEAFNVASAQLVFAVREDKLQFCFHLLNKMSQIKNLIPKTVNPDLQKERAGAQFDVEEFAAWWLGGEQKLKTKREIGK